MIFQVFLNTLSRALLALGFVIVSCADSGEAPAQAEPDRVKEDAPVLADSQAVPASHVGAGAQVTVDWSRPAQTLHLSERLREISGIAVLDDRHVAAVQDEAAVIYVLDRNTGAITDEYDFGKKGDYEDIAFVNGTLWILRSDAALFEVRNWRAGDLDVVEHETPLKQKCDAEGLAYDQQQNRLLVACKEDPGKDLKDARAVYAFDVAERKLVEEPVYTLTFDALAERVASGRAEDVEDFKPSALALHPDTGALYVLSSVMKALAVVTPGGVVEAVYELPGDLFAQPEGLAFTPDGHLLISNEGPEDPATLLAYEFRH